MKIGTVREIKKHGYRVGLTPACVKAYTKRGRGILLFYTPSPLWGTGPFQGESFFDVRAGRAQQDIAQAGCLRSFNGQPVRREVLLVRRTFRRGVRRFWLQHLAGAGVRCYWDGR